MALLLSKPGCWEAIRGNFGFSQSTKLKTQKVSCVFMKLFIYFLQNIKQYFKNISDEIFDTKFQVNVIIKGLDDSKLVVLDAYSSINRTRHLKCTGNTCEDFTIMHLAWLEFSHYQLNVNFYGLNHKRYNINKLYFYVRYHKILINISYFNKQFTCRLRHSTPHTHH